MLADVPAGRIDDLPAALASTLATVRDAAGSCAAQVRTSAGSAEDAERLAAGRAALAALEDVSETADRILGAFGPDIAARPDVVWMDRPADPDSRRPPTLRVAPLEVGTLLADRLFRRQTVVLTSATLALGGSFEPLARQWGLPPAEVRHPPALSHLLAVRHPPALSRLLAVSRPPAVGRRPAAGRPLPLRHPRWASPGPGWTSAPRSTIGAPASCMSPATCRRRAATACPSPTSPSCVSSSRRPAAARWGCSRPCGRPGRRREELRGQISQPLLCQGDDATAELVRQFVDDEASCLFGTLSLWQGVDVPGRSLQLVVIDRIPFPRPDDPLASARQRAVAARGGNGFMTVAAAHAALLLAQGAGRLLRTMDDKGMVAILDPRLATARYGGFLRASLPPFWTTTDPGIARAALRRLAAEPGCPPGPKG